MNSRERVRRAIQFQQPERLPVSHAVLPAAQIKYGAALNELLAEFREDFGWDTMTDLPLAEGHSDGRINEIIGDLIEIGVHVINCQAAVVGYDWIAANARGKVAFRTDIDRQRVMPFGTPAEVREEVRRVFEACGTANGGGIIACGEVGPDVPLENIGAMYEEFRAYRPPSAENPDSAH
jgi:hypothetical protein